MITIEVKVGDELFDINDQPRTNTRLENILGDVFTQISIKETGNVAVGVRLNKAYSSRLVLDGQFSVESTSWGDYLNFEFVGPVCELKLRGKQEKELFVRQTNE